MALTFVSETILLLKVDCFEGILRWSKLNRMVNDHSSSCKSWHLQIIYTNIAKEPFAIFSHAYKHYHWYFCLEFFSDAITFWRIFELDQNRRIVSIHWVAVICINLKLSLIFILIISHAYCENYWSYCYEFSRHYPFILHIWF